MGVIQGLLRIKQVRESAREGEMRRARARLDEAVAALRQARDDQQRRDAERSARERALYADVCTRPVVVRELDELRLDVEHMRGLAQLDRQAVEQAEEERARRRELTTTAEEAWRQAAQTVQKFESLADAERDEERARAETSADLELEEHQVQPMQVDLAAHDSSRPEQQEEAT